MKMNDNRTCREAVDSFIGKKYGAHAEYLWQRDPNSCVYRHEDNRKWFGIIMVIPREKLGLEGSGRVEILNLKLSDVLAVELLTQNAGFFPAYHMGSGSTWVTILLDGTVQPEQIYPLIDESFGVTAPKAKKDKLRAPKEWLIPANPKYYDIESAFRETRVLTWKQGAGIRKGDTVYMYVGAPVSAVLYKCAVEETDIPCDYRGEHLTITKLMKIRLLREYDRERFTFAVLNNEFGIFAVRGPRGVPNSLSIALND